MPDENCQGVSGCAQSSFHINEFLFRKFAVKSTSAGCAAATQDGMSESDDGNVQ